MPRDRSRSPVSDDLWISRAIASFGRYSGNRPRGLQVDEYGCMRLDDIMRCWGDAKGLQDKDVMHAIRQHMFRETAAGGSLRFAIDGDAQGGIVIRVMPSKEDGQRVRRRPTFDDQPYERGLLGRAFGMRQPPERRIPKMHGSVSKIAMPKPMPLRPCNGRASSLDEKLDMSLDDCIRNDDIIDLEADNGKRDRVFRSFRQMGLTPDSMHLRRAPMEQRERRGRRDGKGRHRWSPAEKVQRWISWVVQAGYKDLGISLAEGGWVSLAALCAVMPQSRPDFGDFDAEKLKIFIQDSDPEGRFEINLSNQLRKVPKDQRQVKSQRSPFDRSANKAPRDPMALIEVASSASGGSRRGRSPSLDSSNEVGPADDLEDAALAAQCENLRVSGDMEEVKEPVKAESRWPAAKQVPVPDPPPGEYWQRFQDEGGGDYWYYYEGPLGQWWAGAEGTTIMPYVSDS